MTTNTHPVNILTDANYDLLKVPADNLEKKLHKIPSQGGADIEYRIEMMRIYRIGMKTGFIDDLKDGGLNIRPYYGKGIAVFESAWKFLMNEVFHQGIAMGRLLKLISEIEDNPEQKDRLNKEVSKLTEQTFSMIKRYYTEG